MLVYFSTFNANSHKRTSVVTGAFFINLLLLYTLNFIIAALGIASIPKILKQSVSYCKRSTNSLSTKEVSELYWATVAVCAVINVICTVLTYLYFFHACGSEYCSTQVSTILACILPLKVVLFAIEVPLIWILVKDFKISDSFFCCSNRYLLQAVHTLAVCHILWFLHRAGCSLLVAIFFVALAPTQTLAAITLMYFVIFSTILYLAFNFHYVRNMRCSRKSFRLVCKLFVIFLFYFFVVGFLLLLTLLFNTLAANGLASSGLGKVILSLVAPTIVFVITLQLKKHLEGYLLPVDSNSSGAGEEAIELMDQLSLRIPLFDKPQH